MIHCPFISGFVKMPKQHLSSVIATMPNADQNQLSGLNDLTVPVIAPCNQKSCMFWLHDKHPNPEMRIIHSFWIKSLQQITKTTETVEGCLFVSAAAKLFQIYGATEFAIDELLGPNEDDNEDDNEEEKNSENNS